jgi:xyloglucan-specific exo-beta-1,4-glucanase
MHNDKSYNWDLERGLPHMPRTSLKSWLAVAMTMLCFALPARGAAAVAHRPYDWQSIPWGGAGFVDGFLYHPKQKNILYARTDIGGMYRFNFAAKRWIPLLDHLGRDDADLMGVLSMAVDPSDPAKIYAACGLYLPDWARKGAILRSNDQGETWQKTELPIHVGGNADGRGTGDRLAVDPKNGDILYYGSNQDGLWKSTDGGKSFSKAGSPADAITMITIDPRTEEVYAGGADGDGGLFVSGDGGKSFQRAAGTPEQIPQHAVFAPDGALYVTFAVAGGAQAVNPSYAVAGSLWKRDERGTWSDISPVGPDQKTKFGFSGIDVGPDGVVAVSTLDRWQPGDDVFVSRDGGDHWMGLGEKSRHDSKPYPWLASYSRSEDRMGHWISDLKINPFNRDEMIYGTGYGVWMSRNLSAAGSGQPVDFDFTVANLEEGATIEMTSPAHGPVLLAAFGDVGGAAWSDITRTPDAGVFRPAYETNFSIDYAGLRPAFLARTTSNDPTHAFLSVDGGITWTAMPSTPYKPQEGKAEWHSPGVIAVSAKGTSMLWVPEKDAAYFSINNGKTWTASAGWPSGRDQALIPVADKAIDGVYYVLDRFSMSILISVDAGASFRPIVSGLPKIEGWESAQLAVVPGRMRDLWLAVPYGLLHSPDSTTPVTDTKDVDAAWAVGFGAPLMAGAYPAVYLWGKVNKQEGLWRSDDEGAAWVRINDDAHQFGRVRLLTGDMRQFGTIYIAPDGRGVMVGNPAK